MRVEIAEVQLQGERQLIRFRCTCGVATGSWIGETPTVGDEKFVEFDADDELVLGKNAEPACVCEPLIRSAGDAVEITAVLTAKHEDEGTVTLAFDNGRLEIDVDGVARPSWEVGGWYTVLVASLAIYDMNL